MGFAAIFNYLLPYLLCISIRRTRRFKGSISDLVSVRSAVSIPVLRKDFIVTELSTEKNNEEEENQTVSLRKHSEGDLGSFSTESVVELIMVSVPSICKS